MCGKVIRDHPGSDKKESVSAGKEGHQSSNKGLIKPGGGGVQK